MAKSSPFSSAGGGNADTNPHSTAARKNGGSVCRSEGGSATLREAKSGSIGRVPGDGEDVKPRLDRKRGGKAACKNGGSPRGR
jgi:hypothetical protein